MAFRPVNLNLAAASHDDPPTIDVDELERQHAAAGASDWEWPDATGRSTRWPRFAGAPARPARRRSSWSRPFDVALIVATVTLVAIILFAWLTARPAHAAPATGLTAASRVSAFPVVGPVLAADQRTDRALEPAVATAESWLAANRDVGATSVVVYDLWRVAPGDWRALARLELEAGSVDAVMRIGRELERTRRHGRWVDDWHPSGRLAVTRLEPVSATSDYLTIGLDAPVRSAR